MSEEQSCYKVVNLPNLHKKGGGADGYIPDFKPVIFGR